VSPRLLTADRDPACDKMCPPASRSVQGATRLVLTTWPATGADRGGQILSQAVPAAVCRRALDL